MLVALAVLAVIVAIANRGDGTAGGSYGGDPPDYERLLAGAPPPLAALHEQGNELLGGGLDALEARVAALRGFPVVVNVWASWCGPCRFEFPHFQELSAELGKEVAFLGVDSDDSSAAATTFLEQYPVPYPSYSDPEKEIWDELELLGLPATAFYDETGALVHVKQGGYADVEALRADVERYAPG